MAITAAQGAFSGLVATIPMTIAMEVLRRRLPRRQRQALPPRKITTRAIRKIGIHRHTDRRQREVAALIGHLGYGAAAGSVYPVLARRIEAAPPVIAGLGFGLAVWLVSYMGWLPAARLYGPPTRDTGKRSALMIAAHLVWGGALGMLFDRRSKPPRSALRV